MVMLTTVPKLANAAALLALAGSLAACGSSAGGALSSSAQSSAASGSSAPASGTTSSSSPSSMAGRNADWAVPGYAVGEIPPVPGIVLPDLSLLSASQGAFDMDVARDSIGDVPGITVAPARCDGTGVVTSAGTVLYGDGSGVGATDDGGTVVNYGDGSGVVSTDDATITNYGDGSGTYSGANGIVITNYGDGSGTYSSDDLVVTTYGDGSGTSSDRRTGEVLTLYGDGSGVWSAGPDAAAGPAAAPGPAPTPGVTAVPAPSGDGATTITNYGDGSGVYSDARLAIVNYGEGEALVTGPAGVRTVQADPLPPAPRVGTFPPIDAIAPVESCGTTITLKDGVLFDFGEATVRPDAAAILTGLAGVLQELDVPEAHVYGHTDSISDEDFNQKLSEARAAAVVEALQTRGVTARLDAEGFGETRPVAPNENSDGSDNPAGRSLNRRVEIFIPAF